MLTYAVRRTSFLAHHGILGQKWGIRRFQKKDGTLTSAGKKRYSSSAKSSRKKVDEIVDRVARTNQAFNNMLETYNVVENSKKLDQYYEESKAAGDALIKHRQNFFKDNPPDSEVFQKHLHKRMNDMIDDDELKELILLELDYDLKNKNYGMQDEAFKLAYEDYTFHDPEYQRLITEEFKADRVLRTESERLAKSSYMAKGPDAFDEWGAASGDSEKRRSESKDISLLAYVMREQCVKRSKSK